MDFRNADTEGEISVHSSTPLVRRIGKMTNSRNARDRIVKFC